MARVLVPLADGCEELEAVTIIDLLRRADVEVVVAGLADGPVKASRGVTLLPDLGLEAVLDQSFDMIVLPGGKGGAERLADDARIASLLRRLRESDAYTAAICAAPGVLAKHGLLKGRKATSYPGFLDAHGGHEYLEDSVVIDGKLVTSRGPGTAMDFALTLIELLEGRIKRDEVERALMRPAHHLER